MMKFLITVISFVLLAWSLWDSYKWWKSESRNFEAKIAIKMTLFTIINYLNCSNCLDPKEISSIFKIEDKQMTTIYVKLRPQNYNDKILIDGNIVSFEEGSLPFLKVIKVRIDKIHKIKVGNCDEIEVKITKTSENSINPCR